jgi:thioredoxin reductase (NADPH)
MSWQPRIVRGHGERTGVTERRTENVIIVGGGPAGYTAALYTARANLEPLVFEGFQWGGQLQNTTDVENYPGYPEGIMGPEMMQQFRAQAERFGTRFETDDVDRVELSDGGVHKVHVGDQEHLARTVILAMGAEPRRLGIPGETELAGRGVSTCGVCDGAFFKDQRVIVVGGGDSAMEDAIFISKYASELTIVHRRDEFRASQIMLERARERPNIRFKTPYVPEEFVAGEDGRLAAVRLRNADSGELEAFAADGAFVAIGHIPKSEIVEGQVETDENGYVLTQAGTTRTNLAGVFAVGDLVDHTYRQAVTAAGTGCMGALDAEWYLRDTPPSPEAHWQRGGEPLEVAPTPGA